MDPAGSLNTWYAVICSYGEEMLMNGEKDLYICFHDCLNKLALKKTAHFHSVSLFMWRTLPPS